MPTCGVWGGSKENMHVTFLVHNRPLCIGHSLFLSHPSLISQGS